MRAERKRWERRAILRIRRLGRETLCIFETAAVESCRNRIGNYMLSMLQDLMDDPSRFHTRKKSQRWTRLRFQTSTSFLTNAIRERKQWFSKQWSWWIIRSIRFKFVEEKLLKKMNAFIVMKLDRIVKKLWAAITWNVATFNRRTRDR